MKKTLAILILLLPLMMPKNPVSLRTDNRCVDQLKKFSRLFRPDFGKKCRFCAAGERVVFKKQEKTRRIKILSNGTV